MCRVLKVSRSTYYAWLKLPDSQRKQQDAEILKNIKSIHEKSRKTYGSPRIHRQLRKMGIRCSKKRVERLMRTAGIRSIQKKKYKATTNSKHEFPVAENKLNYKGLIIENIKQKSYFKLVIMPSYSEALARWHRVNYCENCNVVFTTDPLPGKPGFATLDKLNSLLYDKKYYNIIKI